MQIRLKLSGLGTSMWFLQAQTMLRWLKMGSGDKMKTMFQRDHEMFHQYPLNQAGRRRSGLLLRPGR